MQKKIIKKVKQISPNTKVVFSSLIIRKDKKVVEVNSRLKNLCAQKNIDFIDNANIKEDHLGNKKLYLNKGGNTVLANNLLKYLRSAFWNVDFLNCYLESNNSESNSKSLDISSDDPSSSNLKCIRRKNLHRIIVAHLNINSLRSKFDSLVDQITGNVDILVRS